MDLLDKFDANEQYRLVGLAAFDLLHETDPFQPDLFTQDNKKTSLERTIDAVDEKFGSGSIRRASHMASDRTLADMSPNLDFIEDNEEQ